MEPNEKIRKLDIPALRIIHYGDPRLNEICMPVDQCDESLRQLVQRMLELMLQGRGIGLAAPQVGVTVRLFVASPTFQEDDRRIYVNPEIISAEGTQESEEGCLSFPDISCNIKRHNIVTVRALNLEGESFEETGEELTARIFEHEIDHLDGRLLVDRMGSVARMTHRRALKDLRQRYAESDTQLAR